MPGWSGHRSLPEQSPGARQSLHEAAADAVACRKALVHFETVMHLTMILLILVTLMLVGAMPTWPHSRSWGYAPSGVLGLGALFLLVLVLMDGA